MVDKDTGNVIVFNGEIYNYREIKSAFSDISWETNSDTEVILKLYVPTSLCQKIAFCFAFQDYGYLTNDEEKDEEQLLYEYNSRQNIENFLDELNFLKDFVKNAFFWRFTQIFNDTHRFSHCIKRESIFYSCVYLIGKG